jgi:hypothetical protein
VFFLVLFVIIGTLGYLYIFVYMIGLRTANNKSFPLTKAPRRGSTYIGILKGTVAMRFQGRCVEMG